MNNILIHVVFYSSLGLFFSCNSEKNSDRADISEAYRISGTIVGVDSGQVVMDTDTANISNGKFEFTGTVEAPDRKYLRINNSYGTMFFVENRDFTVTIDTSKADEWGMIREIQVSGSPVNEEYQKVNKVINEHESTKNLNSLFDQLDDYKARDKEQEHKELMSDARDEARKFRAVYIKNYALENRNSVVAAYWMQFQNNDVDQTFDEFEGIVEGFDETVRKTSFYSSLKEKLEILRAVRIGAFAPDFTLKTVEDKDFTLSSLKGKIVLVDFWASWCVPCRKAFPHMKELYSKYKDSGFEIVGVTNDSNHEAWKKAIADDGVNWLHVADEFEERGPARVISAYGATYLPSTYLLDKEGKIIAKNLHADELDQKLEEIFGY